MTSDKESGEIERFCGECDSVTTWERTTTAFGDGFRCECRRCFIELSDVNWEDGDSDE